ncbi:MAG: hypothetical protein QG633_320 [Patescibacteria group bacterium]|jgi:hypothetical protein|nr:hypothetical protein [Patescibacteria group bacterium]
MNTLAHKILTLLVIFVFAGNIVTPIITDAGFGNFSDSTQDNFEKGVVLCASTALMLYALSLIPGLSVPSTNLPDTIKDTVLDCLFWGFKNALIQEVTGSTTQWVQTGMNGNPAFVQAMGAYLRSVADKEVGKYIQNMAPFLCSPFRADIQLQLTLLYKNSSGRGSTSSCTLTESVENIDAFLAGDFNAGGWAGWQAMFSSPQNNPYGAYFEARDRLAARIDSASGQATAKLEFGNGFLSKEVQTCYGVDADGFQETIDPDNPPDHVVEQWCDEPKIVTPGAQIKTSLEQAFGTNLDQVASADEFDEIFNLLAAWLISDILTQEGGLAEYDPETTEHAPPVVPPGGDDWGGGGGDQCELMTIGNGQPGQPRGLLVNEPAAFTSTASDPFREINIDVPTGQNYSRVTAEFDLTTAPQTAPDNASQLNLFWLHRGPNVAESEWGGNDIAEVVLNTENGKVRLATAVNSCAMIEKSERSPFRDNLTYHVVVDYNPGNRTMSVKVDGTTVVSQSTTVDVLQSGDQNDRGGFFIKLGNAEDTSADEGLADGFTWSNLRVNFEPGGTTTGGGGGGGNNDDGGGSGDTGDGDTGGGGTGATSPAERAALALHTYARSGQHASDPVVLDHLRSNRLEGWNSFGGSQNIAPMAHAATGDYQFLAELADVENSEGIGSREVGPAVFYFGMPIAAKIVALRDARAAGDSVSADAIARNLLQTWTLWSLVAVDHKRTSIFANAAGVETEATNNTNVNGLTVAVAGDRWATDGNAQSYRNHEIAEILSWALDVPRSGNNKNLQTSGTWWWDTIIGTAIGSASYSASTPAEKWGMSESDRQKLVSIVNGDTSALPWALSVISPGLFESYKVRMRRTTEGVETIVMQNANNNKPTQAATSITNSGAVMTMRPCTGNASSNGGYGASVANGVVTASGAAPRCTTVTQPELGGTVLYEVNFDNGRVN